MLPVRIIVRLRRFYFFKNMTQTAQTVEAKRQNEKVSLDVRRLATVSWKKTKMASATHSSLGHFKARFAKRLRTGLQMNSACLPGGLVSNYTVITTQYQTV